MHAFRFFLNNVQTSREKNDPRVKIRNPRAKLALLLIRRAIDNIVRVCVRVFFPLVLAVKFIGHTSRGRTGGRSHKISHPPFFCGACLIFSREKDLAIPFPRQP